MKTHRLFVLVTLLAAPLFAADKPSASPPNPGFEKIKSLVGEWNGKMKEGGDVHTTYKIVAAGSAIEEHMSHADMVTMYHVDGKSLMLTHYCAAQNQPRMRASVFKEGDRSLKFSFIDGTNMPDKKAMHMHNVAFAFRDADHFTQEWTLYQDGKATEHVVMEFERAK